VTVTFDSTVQFPDIRIAEYGGIDPADPVDVAAGAAAGTGKISSSGWVTTSNANDLLVAGYFVGAAGVMGSAAGYTQRVGSDAGNILADRTVNTTSAYGVTATISPKGPQVMQMVAFRLAGGGNANTQALSAPGNLSATTSATQTTLIWNGSTDNIGVTGYLVERCAGVGCANFAQIAQVTGINYTDTESLSPACSYTYRIRATDVANLQSGYSNTTSVTIEGP
jgi:cellulose 1,4-beta-cellobiosidase